MLKTAVAASVLALVAAPAFACPMHGDIASMPKEATVAMSVPANPVTIEPVAVEEIYGTDIIGIAAY